MHWANRRSIWYSSIKIDVSYGYLLPTIISAKNKLQKIINANLIYCTALINLLITSLEKRQKQFISTINFVLVTMDVVSWNNF